MRKLDQDSITPLYIQLMESIETEITAKGIVRVTGCLLKKSCPACTA